MMHGQKKHQDIQYVFCEVITEFFGFI